jgi:hypothetical protein
MRQKVHFVAFLCPKDDGISTQAKTLGSIMYKL